MIKQNMLRPKTMKIIYTLVMLAFIILWVYPIILMLFTSVRPQADISRSPFALPHHFTLNAYKEAWNVLDFKDLLKNSLLYAIAGSLLGIIFAFCGAYAFSRLPIWGRRTIFMTLLLGYALPQPTVIIPLYDMLRETGLLGTRLGLVIIHGAYGMPLELLILTGFISGIPRELEMAARVDGCSDIGVIRHVIFPLSVPAMAVGFTLNFIGIWKEFFFALTFLSSSQTYPVTVGILKVTSSQYLTSLNLPAATVILAQLPILILFIFAYRWITEGLFAGAIKG